jgi:hypothetical protein
MKRQTQNGRVLPCIATGAYGHGKVAIILYKTGIGQGSLPIVR